MENLISVIVPIYNVEKYLPKCIDSIINQTYKNLEIILVDDGSPDNSPKICDEYAQQDKRIKVIHKPNGGVSSARNAGLDAANGNFIAFVDSDDWIDPEMYEKLLSKQKENDYDVVFCGYNIITDNNNYKVLENSKNDFCTKKDLSYLLRVPNFKLTNNTYSTTNNIQCYNIRFLYKKTAIGNIRFDEKLSFMEDVRIMLEIFLNKTINIGYIDDCLYNYMVRDSSLSNGKINNLIEKCNNYLISLTNLLVDTDYAYLIDAEKFYLYYMCSTNKIRYNTNDNLKLIKHWNSNKNYKAFKILCNGFSSKLKAFFIHNNITFLFKLGIKLKH